MMDKIEVVIKKIAKKLPFCLLTLNIEGDGVVDALTENFVFS